LFLSVSCKCFVAFGLRLLERKRERRRMIT
jgi:hypothetical protein